MPDTEAEGTAMFKQGDWRNLLHRTYPLRRKMNHPPDERSGQ
jgi:hypothetical protein